MGWLGALLAKVFDWLAGKSGEKVDDPIQPSVEGGQEAALRVEKERADLSHAEATGRAEATAQAARADLEAARATGNTEARHKAMLDMDKRLRRRREERGE